MGEEIKAKPKTKKNTTENLTMADLQQAIDTINKFTDMYRRATLAIKNLERAQGQIGASSKGMFGSMAGDPFTATIMQAVEEAVKQQASKIAEKKMASMDIEGAVEQELEEARSGLEDEPEQEEEEEEEEGGQAQTISG